MKVKALKSTVIVPEDLYVERQGDNQLEKIIKEMGRPAYILVGRQMGKTNLLLNVKRRLEDNENIFVYIDLSSPPNNLRDCFRYIINTALETNPDIFNELKEIIYKNRDNKSIPAKIEHELELRDLLKAISGKMVIMLDEIDMLIEMPFAYQLFAQVRSVYFSRVNFKEYDRLTYVLSGVAEPSDIIKNKRISPFNIAMRIDLDNFCYSEFINFLNQAHLDLPNEVEERIFYWSDGHPRMTWDICSKIEDYIEENLDISPDIVDETVESLYFSDFKEPPLDQIRDIVETDKEVRDAIILIKNGKGSQISETKVRNRLFLAGILKYDYYSREFSFKNRIIEHSLSDQWLVTIDYYPVSHAQWRLWILSKFEEKPVAYNVPTAWILHGKIDEIAIEKAFEKIIQRHESLRTTFVIFKDHPWQKIHEKIDLNVNIVDLSGKNDPEGRVKTLAREEATSSFNLEEGPLLRIYLFRLAEDRHVLMVNIHHMICDSYSMDILFNEFSCLYKCYLKGKESSLLPLDYQYRDYTNWQNRFLESKALDVYRRYWLDKLSGKIPILDLPLDFPRPSIQTLSGDMVSFDLSDKLESLSSFSEKFEVSLFVTILSVVKVLLYYLTRKQDIIVGTIIPGRNYADLENQIGFYENKLALRDYIKGNISFKSFLKQVDQTVKDAYEYQVYPFDKLVNELKLPRDLGRSALFDVMVSFQDKSGKLLSLDSIEISPFFIKSGISKYDLSFVFNQREDYLGLDIEYSTKLFQKDTIKKIGDRFIFLLDTIILKPDEYLKHIVFPVNNVEKKEFYKLSSVQRMTYVFQMLDYEGSNRNISRALLLEGEIDIIKLKESFKKLIKRHESLRTSFEVKEGGPIQIVHQCFDFDFEYYHIPNRDRNDLPMPKIEEIFDGFIRTFDLTKAPIMRGGLIKLENFKYILLVDLHQIICDDISLDIFFKELFEIYEKGEMSKLRLQYKDYVEGQNDSIWKQILKEQEEYWLKEFADEFPVLNLPIDYSRPPLASHNLGYLNFVLNKDETKRLTSLSSNEDVTLYMLLSAILNILLWRLSGSESIVIGMMNERRVQMELLNVIGQFSNWIAIRSSPCRGKSFKEFLKEIKCCILNALLNSDYPYEELVDRLPIKRDISRNPLFDVVFTLEDGNWKLDDIKILKISKIDLRSLKYGANFDLNINGLQIGDTLAFTVKFNADLFKKQTIESFIGYFRNLISSISRNKDQDISEIDIMTEKEKNQMLFNFNDTQSEYPKDKTLPELFGDQVKKSPNSLSVVSMDNQLTYKELNSRANQLGFLLRSKGIKTDHLVGIMLYKSIEMIVGIYSILKAGGAYLPIDPAHPQIRKSYVLADSGAEIILSNKEYLIKNELELQAISLKSIFALDVESSYSGEKSNMEIVNRPSDLAYMIYTSGSTGKPKGILIEHRNVVNLIFGLNERIYKKYKERLKISWISSFAFDASVKQIFAALILGHSLYIVPDAMRFDSEFFRRYKIDITDCTPSIFSMFLMNNLDLGLKHLIIGGEILNRKIVEDFFDQFGKSSTRITNVYGPAECCVDSSLYEIDGNNMDFNESVPLGKPLSNQKIYILDERSKLKPIAIPGELCISGDNLGRGYLNLPEQTSEKFIRNPFYGDERLYRTGDLARWLYNGNIEFLGRIDQQVKIRGYRIELSEIECHLLQHPDIKESVVMVREDRDKGKYLCAYVVPNSDHLSSHELREHLSHKLPEYLIPAYFVQLDSLPLTASGKVDRRALPELESNFLLGEYAPPKNELERKLIEMWSQVLGVDGKTMGIDSNFFDLGGHSLNVIRLAARMQDIFKIRVPIMEIFRFPTIRGLSEYIARIKEKKDENESLSSKNRNPTKGGQV